MIEHLFVQFHLTFIYPGSGAETRIYNLLHFTYEMSDTFLGTSNDAQRPEQASWDRAR